MKELIKIIEIRIQEIQNNIKHRKEIIQQNEQSLTDLNQQLQVIKRQIK